MESYEFEKNKYEKDIKNSELRYNEELKKYNSKINKNKELARKNTISKNLKPNIYAVRSNKITKRGKSELNFLEKINKNLNNLIFIDMVPRLSLISKEGVYVPDLTLICEKTNLHIDIEIDEPYSLKERTPIHYINSTDNERNMFFLESNWCIIRFSENQILNNPEDCINTIKSVYTNLINGENYYYTNLNIEKRWSYEDSIIMESKKIRENYF